ncbi:MAG: DUF2341 domain-containing protein [Planctomycetota bacterium]|nr:DUF2341 domain-containing protein [Planctomycetota bacterium]
MARHKASPQHTAFIALLALAMWTLATRAGEPYAGWQHAGSVFILTTPDGVNLPATTSEDNFPLLVRLHKDFLDFSQTKPNGEDIRFSSTTGEPLAYQIDEWDAANGTASIWVRIPNIKGNARQEIKLHWGKADAQSESNGEAVFNKSNGYVSVWHMGDPVKDEAGKLEPKDTGTKSSVGIIGKSRRFDNGKGLNCGEGITSLPTGASPHSSEVWFRAERPNATILAWGNEQAQGKIVLQYVSPPHIRTDCYFSGGNVDGTSTVPMSQWTHVVHTYKQGEARLYVNGVLDAANTGGPPLAIKSPGRLYIGGWYNNYNFVGDIDEVRVSGVVRSADWVRLEYENQKPMQTLAGIVVQPGNAFSVSPTELTVLEGKSAVVTAKADGAQKIYWVVVRNGLQTVVAVDCFSFTFGAGRVAGDQAAVLQLKAVYPQETKTREIPITIKEEIPEPVVTLKSPAQWNGRDTIEVLPEIGNLAAMQAKGAGELQYKWTVSGGAVIKEVAPDRLILKRSQYTGPIVVKVAVDNGGAPTVATAAIQVAEPKGDPWVPRTPAKDEKPEDNQFYARDDKNVGTLVCNGTLAEPADVVFLKLYAGEELVKTETQKPTADKAYAFSIPLKPGLIKYRIEFGAKTGDKETVLHTASNLVCGDAFLIDGQSNALATDTGEKSPPETNEWIRSYGSPRGNPKGLQPNLWCNPVWKAQKGEKAELGWWGMELAKRLLESQKVPIFIVNGAVGGTRIDQHQRSKTNPTDLSTIYGRMLWRVQQAKLAHGIRAVIWHQGESDQGSDGPDGGYGWETYQQYFVDMSAAWKEDFPNIQHYYIFQIWPNSCSMGNGHGDMLREVQRALPVLYSHMDIMSTLGIKPPGPCHYPLVGWAEFARLLQPLVERDIYGRTPAGFITPPNLKQACYTSNAKDAIALEFDQPVVWMDALATQFYLDGAKDKVASGAVAGNVVTLKLKDASGAQKITYLKEMSWSQDKLIVGANGIAALTFCDVPIQAAR